MWILDGDEQLAETQLRLLENFARVIARRQQNAPLERFGIKLAHGVLREESSKRLFESRDVGIGKRVVIIFGPVVGLEPVGCHAVLVHVGDGGDQVGNAR